MRRSLLLIVVMAMAVLVAGCGSAHRVSSIGPVPRPATGVVVGTLGIEGGVLNTGKGTRCHCQAEAGTVRLISAHGYRIDADVGKSGKFSVRVPTGRYEIIAGLKRPYDWPMGSCSGLSEPGGHRDRKTDSSYVVVSKSQKLHVVVGCLAP